MGWVITTVMLFGVAVGAGYGLVEIGLVVRDRRRRRAEERLVDELAREAVS